MKTIISKIKIVALALATIFMVNAASATEVNNDGSKTQPISYVGNLNDLPVYRLTLNNQKKAIYFVSIKDGNGNLLYSEKVSGSLIVRNYQLEEAPSYDYTLTFEVNNLTENKKAIYNISKTKKIFDEVAIAQVK